MSSICNIFNIQYSISVVAERFIRTLKTKIYKYIISISKNVYIDKLDDIVNKCKNTYHKTIETEIEFKNFQFNKKYYKGVPKFKVVNHVRTSKYENIFGEDYVPNWSEEGFVIKKVKKNMPWTIVISDLNGEKIVGTFYEKEQQKTIQKEFRVERVMKRKGNKLYVKWQGYNNFLNSWIDKKDVL